MIDNLTEQQKEQFFGMMRECLQSKARIDGENEFQKEVIARASDELGIDKKKMRKAITIAHKDSLEEEQENLDEITAIIEELRS